MIASNRPIDNCHLRSHINVLTNVRGVSFLAGIQKVEIIWHLMTVPL